MSFPGNGVVRMDPNDATDFGIGKNIAGFSDSIGGCDMDFAATAARGYAYKADDPRDIEYKCIMEFVDINSGFSISCDTGHHGKPEPCCQGFAYMGNIDPTTSPCEFRFRKEMWHVDYYNSPEGQFTDDRVTFKLNGHGYIGFGFCRYNKPNTTDRVVLEMWFNIDPINHPVDGWFMVKKIEDFPGNGWGNSGDECNGDDDQVGTWSNVQSRMKTNSTSGHINFKAITLREIDVTKSFDDTPPPSTQCPAGQVWNGTQCVPADGGGSPPGGGGSGIPSQISPVISYILINSGPHESVLGGLAGGVAGYPNAHPLMTGEQSMMLALSEDLAETMTDPNPAAIDGPTGWRGDIGPGTAAEGEIGDAPCDHNFSAEANLPLVHTFADGLMVEPYWSNKDNACALDLSGNPGGGTNPPPAELSANIPITFLFNVEEYADDVGLSNADYMALVIGEEIIEGMTDTEGDGWHADIEEDGQIGERCDGNADISLQGQYSDGVWMEAYWSNQVDGCELPGINNDGDRNPGTPSANLKYHGGRVQKNAVINLIFWGSAWSSQTGPSKANMETRIRDKLLNPASNSNQYFDALSQYSGVNAPIFGISTQYTTTEPPGTMDFPNNDNDDTADVDKALNMVADIIENQLNTSTLVGELSQQQYIILFPTETQGGGRDGVHNTIHFDFTQDSNNTTTIDSVAQPNSTLDSNGIAWLEATGEIIEVKNSRNDTDKQDYRWSHDMELAGVGYETTWFVKVSGMTSNGHTAMKLGGGNHSGDCGGNEDQKEGGKCCCWYDIGIRANGDIQTQIERPHPDNTDVDCDDCTMSNIGMSMNNHWIGLKHIVYPENENGDVDHGGIRIKFYISTDAIVDGVPTNTWKLVFNTLDTGQWLDNYEWPPYQELEMRLSNIESLNDLDMYKDRVFIRRWIRGGGTTDPGTGTGRIKYHGGRVMKSPKVNLIFWGQAWDDRVAAPTKANLISAVRDKLFTTDKAFFNNLFQYSGITYPIFGQAVTNLTYPIPTGTRIEADTARLVINNTIETALLPQNADFNNTIYIVFCPLDKILYHASNNVQPDATHLSYKPTLTVTDTGGVDQPTDIIVIQGAFTLKSDINVSSTSVCAGTELPTPPPTDPPVDTPPGGVSGFFYKVVETDNEKEISNESSSDDRQRIMEKINSSSSAMIGKTLKQADVLLRKDSGTTAATPLVYFKIWDSSNNVVYTSPTTFAPNALTTSFVGKTFDCSTNTHAFVNGDKCGCEFLGTDPDEFVWTAYDTSDSGNTGSSGSYSQYKEGSNYDNQTSRRCSMTLWQ